VTAVDPDHNGEIIWQKKVGRGGKLARSMHERRTSAKRRFDCSRFDCSGAGWARGIDPAAAGLVVCIG